ncbi:hypothetical protein GCM10007301_40310 [Azorhizobium oxalatiphilum]|uniref:Uncharacterized protein n=1 Tax=Azorhizobium oxalatiphilum TaxID=980631 RepID=A0A917CB07_9HYPH|nr:hypothetical protein [Azorhizobium oxalatiphilum]GGF76306.1 hypothetical protein GCM10007301_40310 [Azorhizobium oxalatiphilum]
MSFGVFGGSPCRLCAEQHAREAKVVPNLKFQSVWERAPFPIEVPKASRA